MKTILLLFISLFVIFFIIGKKEKQKNEKYNNKPYNNKIYKNVGCDTKLVSQYNIENPGILGPYAYIYG